MPFSITYGGLQIYEVEMTPLTGIASKFDFWKHYEGL